MKKSADFSLIILSILIFTGVMLGIVDLNLARRTFSLQEQRRSMLNPGGVLAGFNARDNSKWKIGDDVVKEKQENLYTVLFRASDSAAGRDYWSMVAVNTLALSTERGLEISFVGVCTHFTSCDFPTAPGALTLLSFGSLQQMHSLAYEESSRLAFLVRKGRLVTSLDVGDDPEDMASRIIDQVLDTTRLIDRNKSGVSL